MKPRLSAHGRRVAHSRYQVFISKGCNIAYARNAAEALTLEDENPDYQRTAYDQQAIHHCWQKMTANNE